MTMTRCLKKISHPYISENGDVICHLEEGIFYGFEYLEGDYITGDTSYRTYTISKADRLEIQTEISEDFIKDVELGASAVIRPIAARDRTYNGTVTYIADMANTVGGDSVVMIYVSIDDNDGFLKPNYSVDIEIQEIVDESSESNDSTVEDINEAEERVVE